MPRAVALALLTLCCCADAWPQHLLVGRLVDVSRRPGAPVDRAKVTVLYTRQETVTKADGLFQFALPPAMAPGSELQIEVEAGGLRIYLPRNGVLTVPAPGTKPVEVQLLPAGSRLFLEPAAIEALLERASKPPPNPARNELGRSTEREPRLQRFLREWAAEYGFGLEDVEHEVKAWGDQIRAKREEASVRQQALAEFQAQHFARAAALFEESASAEGAVLDRIEVERKEREGAERTVLQRFLDDEIRAAEALTQSLKFDEAARVLQGATKRVSRDRYAGWWAEMNGRWGSALFHLGSSGEARQSIASLRAAVAAYHTALQVFTKEFLPQGWAAAQDNLGNAYSGLGERLGGTEGAESLRAAISAHQKALQIYTRESLPQDWAGTQNNLGDSYRLLGERLIGTERAVRLLSAVTAYRNALQIYTRESHPQAWAMIQDELGIAYERLGERLSGAEGVKSLRDSVTAHQNALQIYTRESLPRAWATTQASLGTACRILGVRLSGAEGVKSLRDAVTAHQNALQIYTRESLPQAWATTQNNLGNAYESLGERLSGAEGVESLRAAVAALQSALQVRTKETLPQAWATIQNNLGNAYERLGERLSGAEGVERRRDAVTALQSALQVRTKESLPADWQETQVHLARAYASQKMWVEAVQALESVLSLDPAYAQGFARAASIYHNQMFRFDRAFELSAKRVELGDGELEFIESHLTTARFDGCATRAAALRTDLLQKDQRIVLTALRFACLAADQKSEDASVAGRQLVKEISGLEKVRWVFSGTKHFVGQHPAFAAKSAEWVHLFEALEQGDEVKARASLAALGVPE